MHILHLFELVIYFVLGTMLNIKKIELTNYRPCFQRAHVLMK